MFTVQTKVILCWYSGYLTARQHFFYPIHRYFSWEFHKTTYISHDQVRIKYSIHSSWPPIRKTHVPSKGNYLKAPGQSLYTVSDNVWPRKPVNKHSMSTTCINVSKERILEERYLVPWPPELINLFQNLPLKFSSLCCDIHLLDLVGRRFLHDYTEDACMPL